MTAQIGELTRCLDLIRFKVGVYEDILAQDTAGPHCDPASSPEGAQLPRPEMS